MAIKTGTLRRKFSESLERHILCRNSLLMTLAAMKGNSVYSKEDREKVARILLENGSTAEDILKIVPQIERDYCPTNAQVNNVLEVILGKYTYKTDYIANKFLRTVNQEDLGGIETKKSWKRNGEGLKQYIFENELVEELLTEIGCEHIKYHPNKEYWSCSNPDGDNPSAVIVKNAPYLGVRNYTREDEFDDSADIITLVEYGIGINYNEAYDYICEVLGLTDVQLPRGNYHKEGKDSEVEEVAEIEDCKPEEPVKQSRLSESVLRRYIQILPLQWHEEGITRQSAEKFNIHVEFSKSRKVALGIIIPIRDYSSGKLIALSKRTTIDDYTRKVLGIQKYTVTPGYLKSQNIYGLFENRADILEKGYVVIYEAEKSVLKRDSANDPTGVAIQGHELSEKQAEILLSLNVDIIVSMDKDIKLDDVYKICEKLYSQKTNEKINIYYTPDNHGMLGEKDSIADVSSKDYDLIFSERVLYNETEHEKYQACLSRKNKGEITFERRKTQEQG